ncbi:MAG: nucleotidyltransferase domain-containing protein, partial [Promethearchaeia archaeon]
DQMDRETIEKVRRKMEEVFEEEGIELDEVIVFGSKAGEQYREKSDVDILFFSEDFEGEPWYERPAVFYRYWDYDELPEPQFVCLTPTEFEEKKERKPNIVRTAVEEGVGTEV